MPVIRRTLRHSHKAVEARLAQAGWFSTAMLRCAPLFPKCGLIKLRSLPTTTALQNGQRR
jgi:hypothetical protein